MIISLVVDRTVGRYIEELHGVLFSFLRCIESISLPQYAPHYFARLFMLMLTVRELLYSLASIARILA